MLGLFGTMNLGARALQTQQQGVEVTGHNLANVNNVAYSRQRVSVQTSGAVSTNVGMQGTGAEVVGIQQIRDLLLDRQVESETSVTGYWDAHQRALQYAQSDLGEQIDRNSTSAEGAAASAGLGTQQGIAEGLSSLFNAFQSLSTNPTSLTERQVLLQKAQTLSERFSQVDHRLTDLKASLDVSLASDITKANQCLTDIAQLNVQINQLESRSPGLANDLRDLRQQKVEQLSKFVKVDVNPDAQGNANISIGNIDLVTGQTVNETLETYDAGSGQMLVRGVTSGTPLTITGGSMAGAIDARDGSVSTLQSELNGLATLLISEINTVHRAGSSLNGSTGADLFIGTDATSIEVSPTLLNDPSLLQASGDATAVGDNRIALQLAQFADKKHATLGNQTFGERYSHCVAALGESLDKANNQVSNQGSIQTMLSRQRDSISGVSLDEEMTEMIKYQKAFQASARLISTISEMLDTVIGMKQ